MTAVSGGVSTPSVRAAACAGVDSAIGVAKEVAMCWTTLAIRRILLALPLLRHTAQEGPGSNVLVVLVGLTGVILSAVLPGQTPAQSSRLEVACGIDPVEIDVRGRNTSERAHG